MEKRKEAVVGVVRYNGSVLLVRKISGNDLLSGEWHIPGETKERGETDDETLRRGIREEAGIEIRVGNPIGMHKSPKHTEVRWYECMALSYRLNPGSDVDDAVWVPYSQIPIWHSQKAVLILPDRIKEYLGYR